MSDVKKLALAVLPLLAAIAAFWLLLLAPKREEASTLGAKVTSLEAEIADQEQLVASAELARDEFPRHYKRLVVLGKAAPESEDTSSLLVQLDRISEQTGVAFNALELQEAGAGAPPPQPTAPQTPAETAEQSEQRVADAEQGQPASPPPATEAQAALLPIGATIGPAGLPVMRYELSFNGDFFKLADFMAGLDGLVRAPTNAKPKVRGRLITIDGFELSVDEIGGSKDPDLSASFVITTYLAPPDGGMTAGATPTGPAPASTAPSEPAPASAPAGAAPSTTATAGVAP